MTNCDLKLYKINFDRISFERFGEKNDNNCKTSVNVTISKNIADESINKVAVSISIDKKDEYSLYVQCSGLFQYKGENELLIKQNAVAIILPYVRSEVTLLTAQPGMEPVVLPPLNVQNLIKK